MISGNKPAAGYQRTANLRQRLLQTSRIVNLAIVSGLHECGFTELRSTHTTLLSHLALEGDTLTGVAQRAGISKQAMGRLADELIELGYIRSHRDEKDRRAIKLEFTDAGLDLMNQSFVIMQNIERRCARRIGKKELQTVLDSLRDIADELGDKSVG